MKSRLFFTLIIAAVFIVLPAVPTHAASGQTGRYQLFQGEYRIGSVPDDTVTTGKDVFKIDTVTGKTWVYMTGIDENRESFEFWREIPENKKVLKTEDQSQ